MGRKEEQSLYIRCGKCKIIIHEEFSQVHSVECGTLRSSHPYIEDGVINAKVKYISSNFPYYNGMKSKKLLRSKEVNMNSGRNVLFREVLAVDEPKFINKVAPTLQYKVVLLHENDMVLSNIKNYSACLVCSDEEEECFRVVASNTLGIGNAIFYDTAVEKFIPSIYECKLIKIQSLNMLHCAQQITLLPPKCYMTLQEKEEELMLRTIACKICNDSPLNPLNIVKVGSKLYPDIFSCEDYSVVDVRCSENCDNSTCSCIHYSDMITVDNCDESSSKCETAVDMVTIDSYNASDISTGVADGSQVQCSVAALAEGIKNITIPDSIKGDSNKKPCIIKELVENLSGDYATSTPIKSKYTEDDCLTRDSLSFSGIERIIGKSFWVKVDCNTVISMCKDTGGYYKSPLKPTKHKAVGYECKQYYFLKNIIQKKLILQKEGNNSSPSWTGILLYGHKGVGKTRMVKQLAVVLNMNLVLLTISHLTGVYQYDLKLVKEKFEEALKLSPSIIFLDEVDSLCPALQTRIPSTFNIEPCILQEIHKLEQNKSLSDQICLTTEDLRVGLKAVVTDMKRLHHTAISPVSWNNIWGYETVKQKIMNLIRSHCENPKLNHLKGILLYGPPGCSKTLFVKAIIYETGFSFFPVKCSNLISKYVGETEKSLSKLFAEALDSAPSIIFMDEIDSLCSKRDLGMTSGLVSELLTHVSSVVARGNVLLVGATNRPQAIDEALLQPGCLESIICIGLPDFDSRLDMWTNLLKGRMAVKQCELEELACLSEGYSGAEVVALCQIAARSTLSRFIQTGEQNGESLSVSMDDLRTAILRSIRRVDPSVLKNIEEFTLQRLKHTQS